MNAKGGHRSGLTDFEKKRYLKVAFLRNIWNQYDEPKNHSKLLLAGNPIKLAKIVLPMFYYGDYGDYGISGMVGHHVVYSY